MKELYCGIDVHKESFVGCVLDKEGNVVREHTFPPTSEGFEHFIAGISSAEVTIAVEACNLWRPAQKILAELGYTIKLANPVKTHQIACKKKTDKVDAKILADLLRTNYLPEVYIPTEQVLGFRDLVRHKCDITKMKVRAKIRIKAYLLKNSIPYEKKIWNKKELGVLEALEKLELNDLIDDYRHFASKEAKVLKRIKETAEADKLSKILATHPGIGEFGALMMIAEIGDVSRFQSYKQLISYAGFSPGIYQSANTSYAVHNNAVNKYLKWIITECSGRAAQFCPTYKNLQKKIEKKKGFKVARRELGRKMLRAVYYMLKNEEEYHAS